MAGRGEGEDSRQAPGGIEAARDIKEAAQLDALGLDGEKYLSTSDPVVRISMLARARHLKELREFEREDLAIRIINALAHALKK